MYHLCAVVTLLLLALTITSTTVTGRSTGDLSDCDLTPKLIGATNFSWPYGYFGQNNTYGRYYDGYSPDQKSGRMPWAWWPHISVFYTLRTRDSGNPLIDPTTYSPGRTVELHLRSNDIKRRYIGIILYATNGTVKGKDYQVGSWSFPVGAPFQVRTDCAQGQVVTHRDANLKPLHTRFYWTAPADMTGPVTFKLLIKQGEQNKGNFWYLPKDLVLSKGATFVDPALPQPIVFEQPYNEPKLSTTLVKQSVIGDYGQACANVCWKSTPATPYCHDTETALLKDASTLLTAIGGRATCQSPIMQACVYHGAAAIDSTGTCYFRSDTTAGCPAAYLTGNPTKPSLCFSAPAANRRPVCVCTNDKSKQPINPYAPKSGRRLFVFKQIEYEPTTSTNSASTKFGVSSVMFALLSVASFLISKRSFGLMNAVIVASMILFSPSSVLGHNYIKSVHRSRDASVASPCQKRVGNQPHVQIIANQTFETEWSLGHGDQSQYFFFVTIKESDYDLLNQENLTLIIVDYLVKAPTPAYIIPDEFKKTHLHASWEDAISLPVISKYFDIWNLTNTSDPFYFNRDPVYKLVSHPSSFTDDHIYFQTIQSRYKQEYQTDFRASYQSTLYPYISSAAVFVNPFLTEHSIVNNQADIARFTIPEFAGTGNHILHFIWAGYKDCIDINVLPGKIPVKNRYGLLPDRSINGPLPSVIKFDHCEFQYTENAATPVHLLDPKTMDASICVAECKAAGNVNCNAINIVRAVNPPGTIFRWPNIPWVKFRFNQTAADLHLYDPCMEYSVHDRIVNNCTNVASGYDFGKYSDVDWSGNNTYCYGLLPVRNPDLQVEEDFLITDEPEDPGYYSTCLFLDPWRNFTGIPAVPYTPPSWRNVESCIDCAYHATLKMLNMTQAPVWWGNTAQVCLNCDEANSVADLITLQKTFNGPNLEKAGRPDALQPTSSSSSSSTGASSSNAASSSTSSTAVSSSAASSSTASSTAQQSSSTSSTASASSSTADSSTSAASSSTASDSSSSSSSTSQPESSSSASTSPSSSSSTGSTPAAQAVKLTIRISTDAATVSTAAFKSNFSSTLSNVLNIAASRVTITAVRAVAANAGKRSSKSTSRALMQDGGSSSASSRSGGSDIDFLILPSNDSNAPTPSTAADAFKTQLSTPGSPMRASSLGAIIERDIPTQTVMIDQCSNGEYVTPCPTGGETGISAAPKQHRVSSVSIVILALIWAISALLF